MEVDNAAMNDDDMNLLDPSLQNLIQQKSLQWIFCGGKGGVGKTTTSCCLAIQLSYSRTKVRTLGCACFVQEHVKRGCINLNMLIPLQNS